MTSILVTGGAGYIGSHTVRELTKSGLHAIILDNLTTGHAEAVLEGELVKGDLADETLLDSIFRSNRIDGVMHFASRCYVAESVRDPRPYYEQNVVNTLTLARVMLRYDVRRLVLSSSCSVYGQPKHLPIDENHPQDPVSPYGETKFFIERILDQYDQAYGLRSIRLRYFNAAGASLDGQLGESHEPEPHLIPRILRVAQGKARTFQINGTDYPTRDGSCIRDYIHVVDLALAHLVAYRWLGEMGESGVFNLGTGQSYSVKEVVEAVSRVTGKEIPSEVGPRRPGDPPHLVADGRKAQKTLGWSPMHSDLDTILSSAWRWEQGRRY